MLFLFFFFQPKKRRNNITIYRRCIMYITYIMFMYINSKFPYNSSHLSSFYWANICCADLNHFFVVVFFDKLLRSSDPSQYFYFLLISRLWIWKKDEMVDYYPISFLALIFYLFLNINTNARTILLVKLNMSYLCIQHYNGQTKYI